MYGAVTVGAAMGEGALPNDLILKVILSENLEIIWLTKQNNLLW